MIGVLLRFLAVLAVLLPVVVSAAEVMVAQISSVSTYPVTQFLLIMTPDVVPEGTPPNAAFPASVVVLNEDGMVVGQAVGELPPGPSHIGIMGGPYNYGGAFALVAGPISGGQPAHGAVYHVAFNGAPIANLTCARTTLASGALVVICQ